MDALGDALTNEARVIVCHLLTGRIEPARRHIAEAAELLYPLEEALDKALAAFQDVESALGYAEPLPKPKRQKMIIKGDLTTGQKITVTNSNVHRDLVGRDKGSLTGADLNYAFRPLIEAIKAAPTEKHVEAEAKLEALKQEVAKGKNADDGVIAKLVDGLVGLFPAAATAVVSACASPILAGIAGPVTACVLRKAAGE